MPAYKFLLYSAILFAVFGLLFAVFGLEGSGLAFDTGQVLLICAAISWMGRYILEED